jgi:hypothetical protein
MKQSRTSGNGKALRQIVEHMLQLHGSKLHLPPLSTRSRLADEIAKRTKLSAKLIKNILEGKSGRPNSKTCERLVQLFSGVAIVEPAWFLADTFDAFLALLEHQQQLPTPRHVTIQIPTAPLGLYDEEWICGTYVTYRYSFEAIDDSIVAREVMHVARNGDALNFTMSFWANSDQPGQIAQRYAGNVVPIGRSVMAFGFNTGTNRHDRARAIFLDDDRGSKALMTCRFGIMTSTRLHGDYAPCCATTIIIRAQWVPPDIDKFIDEVTEIASFDKIIKTDFGNVRDDLVSFRAFLDNRPLGAEKSAELAATEGLRKGQRDPVLRLNPNRFNRIMPRIVDRVHADDRIFAPFKENWRNRPVRASV